MKQNKKIKSKKDEFVDICRTAVFKKKGKKKKLLKKAPKADTNSKRHLFNEKIKAAIKNVRDLNNKKHNKKLPKKSKSK